MKLKFVLDVVWDSEAHVLLHSRIYIIRLSCRRTCSTMFALRRSRGFGVCRTVRREVGGVRVQVNDYGTWHILRESEHLLAGYVILGFPAGGVPHEHHLIGPRLHDVTMMVRSFRFARAWT